MGLIWHPSTQMYTAPDPLYVQSAQGAYLYTQDGQSIVDAIGSWWVMIHGHSHPTVLAEVSKQLPKLQQVIFAGHTHEQAERLCERLVPLMPPGLEKFFFSDDGSTAVEVAIKLVFQFFVNQGQPKTTLLALTGGYHGETVGAMSVSGRSALNLAFEPLLFSVAYLDFPTEQTISTVLQQIDHYFDTTPCAGIILEPLAQGAGGMRFYSPGLLDQITAKVRERNGLVIFDEVMTGFGRLAGLFAADLVRHKPDLMCFSKGLTAGVLPMGLTVASNHVYEVFLSEARHKAFLHGHSFTGNALACAAANGGLDVLLNPAYQQTRYALANRLQTEANRYKSYPNVINPRAQGAIFAFDIPVLDPGYLSSLAPKINRFAIKHGVLLRPLGNVVYLMPPYNIDAEALDRCFAVIDSGLESFWMTD